MSLAHSNAGDKTLAEVTEATKSAEKVEKPSGTEMLSAAMLTFSESEPGGRVTLEIRSDKPRTVNAINALPAFPLSHPNQMMQLYELKEDGSNGDLIGILDDATALPPPALALLKRVIRSSRMLPLITRIDNLLDEYYAFHWFVTTDRGPFEFFTGSPREAIQHTNNGQLIVEDLSGNHFTIAGRKSLDAASQSLLDRAT
jgi:hypothetical protein